MKAFARHGKVRACAGWVASTVLVLSVTCSLPALAAPQLPSLPMLPHLPDVTEQVVQHTQSGIALGGFDPVAYFALGRAVGGQARYELHLDGMIWRFASAANLQAFRRDPDSYRPAFGAYDAVAVSEGRAVETRPDLFRIEAGRLLLFRTPSARDRFDVSTLAKADEAWAEIKNQLAR
jgi:YHS domain-containing protein